MEVNFYISRGNVTADFTAQIKSLNTRFAKVSTFYLKETNGSISPKESCLLSIYFKPSKGMKKKANLILSVDQNPTDLIVNLQGLTITPTLKITQQDILFDSVLPYSNIRRMITIENVNAFPVDFVFTDFDM